MSCLLAPSTDTLIGTPLPSTNTLRLVPDFALSASCMHYSLVFEGLMHFAACVDHSPPSLHPQIGLLRLTAQLCSPASVTSELSPTYFCVRIAASGRLTLRDAIVFTISGTTLIEPVMFLSSGELTQNSGLSDSLIF